MNGTLRKLALPGLLVAGAAGGMTLADVARDPLPDLDAQAAPAAAAAVATADGLSSAFRSASSTALPAVVHVRVQQDARDVRGAQVPDELRGTPWEDMFRGQGGGRDAPLRQRQRLHHLAGRIHPHQQPRGGGGGPGARWCWATSASSRPASSAATPTRTWP